MEKTVSKIAQSPLVSSNEAAFQRRAFFWIPSVALVIRLLVFGAGFDKGLFYPDEFEYVELAQNLVTDSEFSFRGRLTSFRPPGFPFILSLVFRLTGTDSPVPVRVVQMLFSLATVWVIYRLGRDGWNEKVGLVAAGIFAFYPSLIGFNNILLTEPSCVFFISLAGWAMVRHLQAPNLLWVGAAGIALGFGALTRDTLLYAWPVTTVFLIGHALWDRRYRWPHVAAFAGSFAIVISPWVVRNSLLHGQFSMISTVGGINLYLCNSDETPMIHTGAIFVDYAIQNGSSYYYDTLFPELAGASETAKQNLAMRKGLEYIWANPGITTLRSLGRLVDFWGQERLVINHVMAKYYGEISVVLLFAVILAVLTVYSSVVVGASFGYFFTKLRAFDIFGLLFIAYYTGMHVLVQGHPRYHIPLLPFMAVVAARAFLDRSEIWANRRSWRFAGALSVVGVFVIMWIIGISVFDPDKVEMLLGWLK